MQAGDLTGWGRDFANSVFRSLCQDIFAVFAAVTKGAEDERLALTPGDPTSPPALPKDVTSSMPTPAQRSQIELAIYERAKPRNQWISTNLADFRQTIETIDPQ